MAEQVPRVAHCKMYHKSEVAYVGPCLVASVIITGDGGGADADIYDGVSDRDEWKAHLEALSGTTFGWDPGCTTDFDKGIYVKITGDYTYITICWIPESWKKYI